MGPHPGAEPGGHGHGRPLPAQHPPPLPPARPTIDQVSGFRFQRRDEATDPGVVSLLLPGLASVSVSSSSSQPSL